MERPDYVSAFNKPDKTEIKHIGGHWYLYSYSSAYDSSVKRTRKKSGKCLGKITPEGLQPSNRLDIKPCEPIVNDNVDIGLPIYLWERTGVLRARLRNIFPDIWNIIYVICLIRVAYGPYFRKIQTHYENSLFSYMFSGIKFTPAFISSFLKTLGMQRNNIISFMKEDLENRNSFILFDGHRIISSSTTIEYAELGYDSKRRFKPQINLLYIFSLDDKVGVPVYYKQFIGSTPDVTAFSDILTESGVNGKEYTVIADKGFSSGYDFNLIEQSNMKYIIPLRRGNKFIKEYINETVTQIKFEGIFLFNNRPIKYLTIRFDYFNVILFYSPDLYSNELASTIERLEDKNKQNIKKIQIETHRRERGKGRLTDEQLAALQPFDCVEIEQNIKEMGSLTIRTNRTDLNAMQIYHIYKQRQSIEDFFKLYDNSLDFDSSYMRSQRTEESWLFLNHVCGQICTSCIEEIYSFGEDKYISFSDLTIKLGKIKAIKINNTWRVAPIKTSVQKLLSKLELSFTDTQISEVLNQGH